MLDAVRIVLVLASAGPLTPPPPATAQPASTVARAIVVILRVIRCIPFVPNQLLPFSGGAQWKRHRTLSGSRVKPCPWRGDRKSVVWGNSVSVRLDLGGQRHIKKKTQ